MNKIRLSVVLFMCIFLVKGYGQFTMKMKYEVPGLDGTKSIADSILLISPDFQMTGLVIRIDTSDSFLNSFIIADNDTIFLRADEHVADTSSFYSSNLIVFKNILSEFRFYPSAIDNPVELFFINASPSKKVLKKQDKKKRCRLFRTRND